MFCAAMEDVDMRMCIDTPETERKSRYRQMQTKRSFFKRDEKK